MKSISTPLFYLFFFVVVRSRIDHRYYHFRMAEQNPSSSPEALSAPLVKKTKRIRSNYFVSRDIVWIRPAGLPYWPAEVLEVSEELNRVQARLILPPPAALLQANLKEEQRLKEKEARRVEQVNKASSTPLCVGFAQCEVKAEVVTAGGLLVHFFDKLSTPEEFEEVLEDRLKRKKHDVSAYELHLRRAMLEANRLVRIVLKPEMLQPYTVRGFGVVHSLMRTHTSAPRQPRTTKFAPQTAVIRLRKGMENAARDLEGFDYIWVLFQFSYAAPMACGVGQQCLAELQEQTVGCSASTEPEANSSKESIGGNLIRNWRYRQGSTHARGFKTMIIPPRDDELRGVFATRSPHRPNFIGLSCVRLVRVRGLDIHIMDHDLLHGTPVLDIKPYLPFCDAHPDAKAGWVEALDANGGGKGDHKFDNQVMHVHRIFDDEPCNKENGEGALPTSNS